jgi:hypothetical protein
VISALIISADLTIIKKIDLVFVDEGLSFSAVGATGSGYRCTRGFLFVPDGCGVSGAVNPANARRD